MPRFVKICRKPIDLSPYKKYSHFAQRSHLEHMDSILKNIGVTAQSTDIALSS